MMAFTVSHEQTVRQSTTCQGDRHPTHGPHKLNMQCLEMRKIQNIVERPIPTDRYRVSRRATLKDSESGVIHLARIVEISGSGALVLCWGKVTVGALVTIRDAAEKNEAPCHVVSLNGDTVELEYLFATSTKHKHRHDNPSRKMFEYRNSDC